MNDMENPLPRTTDPFHVLGIPYEATDEEVRSAYFLKVKEHPPEKDPEGFKRLRKAFESLREEEDRVDVILNTFPSPPSLDQFLGAQEEESFSVTIEDLRRLALSLTELNRTTFHSDQSKLGPWIDALFDSIPKEQE